jgi:hypothetical protein
MYYVRQRETDSFLVILVCKKEGSLALSSRALSSLKELTHWSSVLEKLTICQLVKKFPAFYGV